MKKEYLSPEFDVTKIDFVTDLLVESNTIPTEETIIVASSAVDVGGDDPGNRG